MKYNILDVAKLYVKGFTCFISDAKIHNIEDCYDLFSYTLKSIYNLETCEFSRTIERLGGKCIKYLSSIKGTPRKIKGMSLKDRISVVEFTISYYVAVDLIAE